jgi:hypothetical protein
MMAASAAMCWFSVLQAKEEKKRELEARGIRVEQLPPGTG